MLVRPRLASPAAQPVPPRSWIVEITDAGREQIRRGLPIAERIFDSLDTGLRRAGIEPDMFRNQVQTASQVVRDLLP